MQEECKKGLNSVCQVEKQPITPSLSLSFHHYLIWSSIRRPLSQHASCPWSAVLRHSFIDASQIIRPPQTNAGCSSVLLKLTCFSPSMMLPSWQYQHLSCQWCSYFALVFVTKAVVNVTDINYDVINVAINSLAIILMGWLSLLFAFWEVDGLLFDTCEK